MYQYLQKIYTKRRNQMNGMEANTESWQTQPENVDTLKVDLTAMETIDDAITNLSNQLQQKRLEARTLAQQMQAKVETTENLIKVVHAADKNKWLEYGMEPEKQAQARPVPTLPLTLTIKDDTDGQGFILALTQSDPNAEMYIWEKGTSADPKATQPDSFKQFREATKISIVDDDVEPGVRYFYRTRAFNSRGYGPNSNIVNKVQ